MKKKKILLIITIVLTIFMFHSVYATNVDTTNVNVAYEMPYFYWYLDNGFLHLSGQVPSNPNFVEGNIYDNINNVYRSRPGFGWYNIKRVIIDSPIKLYGKPIAFAGIEGVSSKEYPEIIGMENLDTSSVTDMSEMFCYSQFNTIDLHSLDMSNVTNMSGMFYHCSNTENIILPDQSLPKLTTMKKMFYQCGNLKSINISFQDTVSLTDISNMFDTCWDLASITFSNRFNTSNVVNMSKLFNYCPIIKNLDLTMFNTSKVTDMSDMFYRCSELSNVNLSSFDTSNVVKMSQMFWLCENLSTLDISNFNVSKVSTMHQMFNGCTNLISLNLGTFDTSSLRDAEYMFAGCSRLTSLDTTKFDFSKLTNIEGMFNGCSIIPEEYKKLIGDIDNSTINEMINQSGLPVGPGEKEINIYPGQNNSELGIFYIKNFGQSDQHLINKTGLYLTKKAQEVDSTGHKPSFVTFRKNPTDNSYYFVIEVGKLLTKDYKLSFIQPLFTNNAWESHSIDISPILKDNDGNIIISEKDHANIYAFFIASLRQKKSLELQFFDYELNDVYYYMPISSRESFADAYDVCFGKQK